MEDSLKETEVVVQNIKDAPTSITPIPPSRSKEDLYAATSDRVRRRKRGLPSWLKFLAQAILGAAIFSIPIVYLHISKDESVYWPGEGTDATMVELFRWSLVSAASIFTFYFTMSLVSLFPILVKVMNLLLRRREANVENLTVDITSLRRYVSFAITSLIFWVLSGRLFGNNIDDTTAVLISRLSEFYVVRTAFALVVFCNLLLVERIIVHRIGRNYHYDYYADRIQENQFNLAAIRKLSRKYDSGHLSGRRLVDLATENESDADYAADLAEDLYNAMRNPNQMGLTPSDLHYALTEEDAHRFFVSLDQDGNGDLTQKEFSDSIQQIYHERHVLAETMSATDDLVKRLHGLGLFFVVAITGSLCLPIFNVSLANGIFSLVGVVVAMKTFFDSTIIAIFNTIIFIFVSHPLDVGDIVLLDRQRFKVKHIGWWSSSFYGAGGQLTYMANASLNEKYITNFRRSGPQAEEINYSINVETSKDQLDTLEEELNNFIAVNKRDYIAPVLIKVLTLNNNQSMTISLTVQHRSNFQNSEVRGRRSSKFLQAVRNTFAQIGIQLALASL